VIGRAIVLTAVAGAVLVAPAADPLSHPGGSKAPGAHREAQ
jgi:hypothetical protein